MKKIFKYLEPIWSGNDGKPSLRSIGAGALIVDFIINVHNSASILVKLLTLVYKDKSIPSTLISSISGNLAQIAMILGIEAALIGALLALKSLQNNPLAALSSSVETTPAKEGEVS
jgi:hypothetical protein